jgi:hypothetical protein
MDTAGKVRENRLRRAAERRGLRLEKSRRRDPGAIGYGTYQLIDPDRDDEIIASMLTMEQAAHRLLLGNGAFHRAGLGEHVDAEAGSVITLKTGVVIDIAITGQHFIVQEDGSLRELTRDEIEEEISTYA